DALVPFVVRVAGESEGWAALKRASALMQSEVPDGSGVGLGAGASAVVDVGCRVRSPLPGGPEGAIALVSGRAIRRRAAEVEEGRRRAAAEEAERQRAAREAEERAYRLSHARELDRQRVEEGKRRQEERRRQFMEMRKKQLEEGARRGGAAPAATPAKTAAPTDAPLHPGGDPERPGPPGAPAPKAAAPAPKAAPKAAPRPGGAAAGGARDLAVHPFELHEVVDMLTILLRSTGERRFAEDVYVETQLHHAGGEAAARPSVADPLESIARAPKAISKVFDSRAKHLCVDWGVGGGAAARGRRPTDAFALFVGSVRSHIETNERVSLIVDEIDDAMDPETIASICF
ncbi:MAG: hypothetical protein VXZ39_11570, partial [Planctomycetota bacterium]|nr:hypothetical protein [Planctomycetota bacterium]